MCGCPWPAATTRRARTAALQRPANPEADRLLCAGPCGPAGACHEAHLLAELHAVVQQQAAGDRGGRHAARQQQRAELAPPPYAARRRLCTQRMRGAVCVVMRRLDCQWCQKQLFTGLRSCPMYSCAACTRGVPRAIQRGGEHRPHAAAGRSAAAPGQTQRELSQVIAAGTGGAARIVASAEPDLSAAAGGRTLAGLRKVYLAGLHQLLQAALAARKPARDPRCRTRVPAVRPRSACRARAAAAPMGWERPQCEDALALACTLSRHGRGTARWGAHSAPMLSFAGYLLMSSCM